MKRFPFRTENNRYTSFVHNVLSSLPPSKYNWTELKKFTFCKKHHKKNENRRKKQNSQSKQKTSSVWPNRRKSVNFLICTHMQTSIAALVPRRRCGRPDIGAMKAQTNIGFTFCALSRLNSYMHTKSTTYNCLRTFQIQTQTKS